MKMIRVKWKINAPELGIKIGNVDTVPVLIPKKGTDVNGLIEVVSLYHLKRYQRNFWYDDDYSIDNMMELLIRRKF